MWKFANKLKNVLTVTLKDELDDIILHYVKELKETEIKLKESEQKLQLLQITHNDDISNKITELLNKNRQLKNDNLEITIENNKLKKQLEETENRLQKLNDKLKESDNKQKKDKNSRWSMLSSFFYK
jgi:chromosome segregation ATPase